MVSVCNVCILLTADCSSGDGSPEVGAGGSGSVPEQKRGRGSSGSKQSKGAAASEKLKESVGDVQKSKKLKQTTLK